MFAACVLFAPGSVRLGCVCLRVHVGMCVGPFTHGRLCRCVWTCVQGVCESGLPGLCVAA